MTLIQSMNITSMLGYLQRNMWPFSIKKSAGPPALTSLNVSQFMPSKDHMMLMDHERRLNEMEDSFLKLCDVISEQIQRIDQNTQSLDRNMHRLAEFTIRPPRNMLGGDQEKN